MGQFRTAALLALLAAVTAAPGSADQSLVIFRPGPALGGFEKSFAPDRREALDPTAWKYLAPEVKGAIQSLERSHGFVARYGYSKLLRGFSGDLSREQVKALLREPSVESITVTVAMASAGQRMPWGVARTLGETAEPSREPGPETASRSPESVRGVTVYVVDSGIDRGQPNLNVVRQVNFTDGPNQDCNGHGTHVAGIIGARDNDIGTRGVAPGVALVGVKVVDCFGRGSSGSLLKGLDWVAATATLPAVVNLSLTGGESPPLDAAVQAAAALGIFFSIAAGNGATDACLFSPALNGVTAGIVTVAAIDPHDREPAFSNFGGCVDIWAPGLAVPSLGGGSVEEPLLSSGTSMAAPHVAGAAALYLARYPKASPADVEEAIAASSTIPGTASKDGRSILHLRYLKP